MSDEWWADGRSVSAQEMWAVERTSSVGHWSFCDLRCAVCGHLLASVVWRTRVVGFFWWWRSRQWLARAWGWLKLVGKDGCEQCAFDVRVRGG